MQKWSQTRQAPPTNLKEILTWWTSREKPMGCIWAVAKTLVICCIWIILPSYITGLFLLLWNKDLPSTTQYFMVHVSQRSLLIWKFAKPCRLLLHWWFLVPKVADWHHGPRCEDDLFVWKMALIWWAVKVFFKPKILRMMMGGLISRGVMNSFLPVDDRIIIHYGSSMGTVYIDLDLA